MPMHSPYFSEHSTVCHREASGEQPGPGGAQPGKVLRHDPTPVYAQSNGRAQADAAPAQHHRVTRRMRPLYHPAHNTLCYRYLNVTKITTQYTNFNDCCIGFAQ